MAAKDYDLDQPMDKLIDIAVKKFGEVEFQPVSVGENTFQVLQIKKMQQYIDKLMDKTRSGKKVSLPLWAKIWPASLVMGFSLTKFPLPEGASVMEIGGGSAICSMALASRGFDVTVADVDQDALLFSRINALKNGLDEKICVAQTDFNAPAEKKVGCIVGVEMLYEERQFDLMADFIDGSLIHGEEAEVFLSMDLKRAAKNFFSQCNEKFNIMKSAATFKDQDTGEDKPVNLFRFKRK